MQNGKHLIYLAGPISGQSYKHARHGWREEIGLLLSKNLLPLSPMRQEGHLAEVGIIDNDSVAKDKGGHGGHIFGQLKAIARKDLIDIKSASFAVFNFKGSTLVSQGSLVELGLCHGMGIPIVVINDPVDPIHHTLFVSQLADFEVTSLEDAAFVVSSVLTPGI